MSISEIQPNREIADLLPMQSFREKSREERRLIYRDNNLLISWDKVSDGDFLASDSNEVRNFIESMKLLGWSPFSEFYVLHSLAYLIGRDNLTIPYDGQFKRNEELRDNRTLRRQVGKARKSFYDSLITRLDLSVSDGVITITEKRPDADIDITNAVSAEAQKRSELVRDLAGYDSFMGYTTRYFRDFVATNKGLLVFMANSNPDIKNPTIAVNEKGAASGNIDRNADLTIPNAGNIYLGALRTIAKHSHLKALQNTLKEGVGNGDVRVVPAFKRSGWIRYGLMDYVKGEVESSVDGFIQENNVICDPLDAQYQVLFRLTSFGVADLFKNGDELNDYIEGKTRQTGWRGLLDLEEAVYSQYQFNSILLTQVIEEQMRLITYRLANSKLPIADIVTKSGIFKETGWEIKKDKGEITAIKRGVDGTIVDSRKVSFREVNKDIATQFHQDLHYIHTPRSDRAFGFYLEDEKLPFAVLAVEPVDRVYKRNTLLLFGYDPQNCLDFTRLYSRPGVPKNVSSAIFGEAFSYFRQHEPRIEAAISAFMPSYASGLSMLTGGFETPILIKPGVHYFGPVNVQGQQVMEHLTKRRQLGSNDNLISSRFPLLPVIELISPLKEPRFKPVLELGKQMVEL